MLKVLSFIVATESKAAVALPVYIRNNIAASRKKLRGKCVESMLFDMKIGQRQFAYITAYKPPSVDNNTFKRELCDLLDEANSLSENVIFTGDLNSDTFNFTVHIQEPISVMGSWHILRLYQDAFIKRLTDSSFENFFVL